jgi:hydrogenase maturation protease
MADALILGLGNELLRDDGVGRLAARRVAELAGAAAELAEACVSTLDLLPLLAGYERVVVLDAYLSSSDAPGTTLSVAAEARPAGFGYRSLHTLPFDEMLALGRALGLPMPRAIAIHGLCVADPYTFGERFSPPVARAWRAWAEDVARQEFAAEPRPGPRRPLPAPPSTGTRRSGVLLSPGGDL